MEFVKKDTRDVYKRQPLSRATLANWIIYCAENYLCHVYDYFHRQLRMRKYLMADETRVQVLNEPERNPETDSWMWLFRSGEDGLPSILLYHYTETRTKFHAASFLQGFSGYLETDGYQGYNNLPDIKRCSCWAHVRRCLLYTSLLILCVMRADSQYSMNAFDVYCTPLITMKK